jgi:hypothetical protein
MQNFRSLRPSFAKVPRPVMAQVKHSNGSHGTGPNASDEPVFPMEPHVELNKYQKLPDDALLSAWNVEGMPTHHTSRQAQNLKPEP